MRPVPKLKTHAELLHTPLVADLATDHDTRGSCKTLLYHTPVLTIFTASLPACKQVHGNLVGRAWVKPVQPRK